MTPFRDDLDFHEKLVTAAAAASAAAAAAAAAAAMNVNNAPDHPSPVVISVSLPSSICTDVGNNAATIRKSQRENLNCVLQGNPHPLCIPSVVSELMIYLDRLTLKSSRLVCQQWAEEGRKTLARRSKILLEDSSNVEDFLEEMNNENLFMFKTYEIGEGVQYNTHTEQLFSKLGIHCIALTIHINVLFNPPITDLVIRKLPNLLHLKICGYWRRSFELSPALKRDRTLKNLQSLIFDIIPVKYEAGQWWSIANFIMLLLVTCKDLKRFQCSETHLVRLVIVIATRREYFFRYATHFEGAIELTEENINTFRKKNMPVECLQLKIKNGTRFPGLYLMLSSIGTTLTTLSIDFSQIRSAQVPDSFPYAADLKNLKYLSLRKFYGPIYFIQHMPSLESLIFTYVSLPIIFSLDDPTELSTPHNLKSLQFYDYHTIPGHEGSPYEKTFNRIVKWFPYLKRFRMEYLMDVALRIILSGLSHIEELLLPKGIYSDHCITGIDESLCRNVLSTVEYDSTVTAAATTPCLQNLRKLRTLQISSPKITDVAIFYSVSLCKEVRSLSMMTYGITDKSLKRIVDDMDICNLKLEFCCQLTLRIVNYAKKKMKGKNVSINEYNGPMKPDEIFQLMTGNRLIDRRVLPNPM